MTIELKPIPRQGLSFDLKGITKSLRRALEAEAKEHRRLLNLTTRTWKGTRPQFVSETIVSPQRLYVNTEPRGSKFGGRGASKWWWLEEGTRTRFALMSGDWRSKTRRSRLRSYSGRGRVLVAGRRAFARHGLRPRPGIEARNWRAQINRKRSTRFKAIIAREFDLQAKNAITPKGLTR